MTTVKCAKCKKQVEDIRPQIEGVGVCFKEEKTMEIDTTEGIVQHYNDTGEQPLKKWVSFTDLLDMIQKIREMKIDSEDLLDELKKHQK